MTTGLAALQDAEFIAADLRSMLRHSARSPLWWLGLSVPHAQRLHAELSERLLQLANRLTDAPDDVADALHELESQALELTEAGPGLLPLGVRLWFQAGRSHQHTVSAAETLEARIAHHLAGIATDDPALLAPDDAPGPRGKTRSRRQSGTRLIIAG